jgi:hypothetical protein
MAASDSDAGIKTDSILVSVASGLVTDVTSHIYDKLFQLAKVQ